MSEQEIQDWMEDQLSNPRKMHEFYIQLVHENNLRVFCLYLSTFGPLGVN